MARLLVATTLRSEHPDFDLENRAAADALADLGLRPELQAWHAALDDWLGADLVLVRTPWDYVDHLGDFVAWLDMLEIARVPVINTIPFLRWSLDKAYLFDLEDEGVPVIPIEFVAAGEAVDAGEADRVLKPLIGTGGLGVEIVPTGERRTVEVDSLISPRLPVEDDGERSVFIVDGDVAGVFAKRPGPDDFRVQPEWGGSVEFDPSPDPAAIDVARRAHEAAAARAVGGLVYLRVDVLRDEEGSWRVLEIEGLGPSLYPGTDTRVAAALADAVSKRLPGV